MLPYFERTTYHVICLLLLCLCLPVLLMPRPAHAASSGNWRTYTTKDGLLSNNIQALTYREDPLDFPPCNPPTCTEPPVIPGLWVGTDRGLTYLNGRESVNFVAQLPTPDVRDLLFAPDGKLWIATTGGLTWLDDNRTPRDLTDDQWGKGYLIGRKILALTQISGQIWAGTEAGLVKIDPASGQDYTYLPTAQVTAVTRCASALGSFCDITLGDHLWFGADGEFYQLDTRTGGSTPEPIIDVPLRATTPFTITGLTRSAEGIWVASDAGVAFWDGNRWNSTSTYDGMHHLPFRDIRKIDLDDQGRIWLATNAGVMYWHTQLHTWQRYFELRDPIADDNIQTLFIDPQGAVWLGTDVGLSGVDNAWMLLNQLSTYDYTAGLASDDARVVVFDDQGRAWIGTNGGGVTVVAADLKVITSFTTANGLGSDKVTVIVIDKLRRVWIGTDGGGMTVVTTELKIQATLTMANGLASNSVEKAVFDQKGRLWVSKFGSGVTVVGKDLKVLASFTAAKGFASDSIRSVVMDPEERTWVSTHDEGVTVIGPDLKVLTRFTTANGLISDRVGSVKVDAEERIWVYTDYGVTVVGANLAVLTRFTTANGLMPGHVYAATIDQKGRAWVPTDGGGVTVIGADLKVLTNITTANGLTSTDIWGAFLDQEDRIWLCTSSGGITVLGADLKVLTHFTTAKGLASDAVNTFQVDEEGRIWIGTTRGMTVVGADLKILKRFTTVAGLDDDYVNTMSTDKKGRTWVGTANGVTVVDADLQVLANFTAANDLVQGNVWKMVVDKARRTWLGMDGGLMAVGTDLKVVTRFTIGNGLMNNYVRAVAIDKAGRTWLGTAGGVTVIGADLQVLTSFTDTHQLVSTNVYDIEIDQEGRAWVATTGGITVVDADLQVLTSFTTAKGLADDYAKIVTIDEAGRVWVGTNGGVTVVDTDLQVLTSFTTANGLAPGNVYDVVIDQVGRAWVGTASGATVVGRDLQLLANFTSSTGLAPGSVAVVTFDEQGRAWIGTAEGMTVIGSDLKVLANVTTANGLANNLVNTVAIDKVGRAWVGTVGGLTVVGVDLKVITSFTTANGLASEYVNTVVVDEAGRIWVGTNGGVSIFANQSRLTWLRISTTLSQILSATPLTDRLGSIVDVQQFEVGYTGGSLLAPAAELGYTLLISERSTNQMIFTDTVESGGLGQAGERQVRVGVDKPLAYAPHRLQLTVIASTLDSYTLPVIDFDVQASPFLTLLQVNEMNWSGQSALPSLSTGTVSPLVVGSPAPMFALSPVSIATTSPTTGNMDALVFPADTTFPLHWRFDDPDLAPGDVITFTYRWPLPGSVQNSLQLTLTQGLSYTTMVRTPKLNRGAADERLNLELSVTDMDGNSSSTQIVRMTILAPISYQRLVTTYFGAIGALILILMIGLVTLSRTSGLPFNLLLRQGVLQWVPVGLGYRRYWTQWSALTPLEQLLLLIAPAVDTTADEFTARLTQQQTPVSAERLGRALENLTRQQWLTRRHEVYAPVEPVLVRALQMHVGEAGRAQLAAQVRDEHPLVATARQFFPAAGFTLETTSDPLAFLCRPAITVWHSLFESPIYTRLFPGRPLDLDAVTAFKQAAQGELGTVKTLFAVIDRAPTDAGWIAIGGLRAEEIQVIPIDDGFMQRARLQNKEREQLQTLLRRFIRRRDLYNVRDPVADRLNFFGREHRLDELLEALAEGRPLALFGLRKMGKSSLLQVLRERTPFPVAHVDLQEGVDPVGLYGRLLTAWQRALAIKVADVAWTPPELQGDLAAAFTAAVRELMAALEAAGHEPRLGLFVDEIELIVPDLQADTQDPTLTRYLAFARALRGLVQGTGHLSLLVAGVDARLNRVNRLAGEQNPFYQFFREEFLEPLSEEDCSQMVRNIGRQMGIIYTDDGVAYVARRSGGHPFLARQLCSAALALRGDDASSPISLEELQAAAAHFVREPATASLLNEYGLWGEVTDPKLWTQPQRTENQTMLTALAAQPPTSEPELLASAQDRAAREQSLSELKLRAVLNELQARLHIQFGLFQDWIRRYRLDNR